MARRSLRSSSGATPQKRASSSNTTTPASLPSRTKRTKVQQTGSKGRAKSQPQKKNADDDDDDDVDSDEDLSASSSESEDDASGYEDEGDASAESSSEDNDDEADEYESSEDDSRKRKRANANSNRRKSNGTKGTPNSSAKGQELWRPGVKTGLGPGTQVIIDKPKPRAAGKIPYQEGRIHPNTLLFLAELKQNNDREWLKMHDSDYRTSWKDFTSFLEKVQESIIEKDETIPELPVKDVVFRIYRDIRFSPDPTPYKSHFSAAWSRTGRKGPYGCYYLHLQPGNSFVGGGIWQPEAVTLAKMRRSIDRHPERIKAALMSQGVRTEYLKVTAKNEKNAVKAFVDNNSHSALKTKPKGYDGDHKDIDLLRLRSYTMGAPLSDEEVTGPRSLERIAELVEALEPFVTFVNNAVMPDDPESDESDE